MPTANASISCIACGQSLSALERLLACRKNDEYVCKECCSRICAADGHPAYENFVAWKLGLKLFFGVLFICSCVYDETVGAAIASILIGLGLIAWGVVPLWLEKGRVDSVVARSLLDRETAADARHTCQMCGGISKGDRCEYCGAPFQDTPASNRFA